MMKNSGLFCILSLIATHILSYYLIHFYYPDLDAKLVTTEITYSCIILVLGTLIMYVKFKKDQFVNRFLGATVFQMLAILTFVVALVYLKIKPVRTHGLLFIFTYLAGMVVQTTYFLRFSKETSK